MLTADGQWYTTDEGDLVCSVLLTKFSAVTLSVAAASVSRAVLRAEQDWSCEGKTGQRLSGSCHVWQWVLPTASNSAVSPEPRQGYASLQVLGKLEVVVLIMKNNYSNNTWDNICEAVLAIEHFGWIICLHFRLHCWHQTHVCRWWNF